MGKYVLTDNGMKVLIMGFKKYTKDEKYEKVIESIKGGYKEYSKKGSHWTGSMYLTRNILVDIFKYQIKPDILHTLIKIK